MLADVSVSRPSTSSGWLNAAPIGARCARRRLAADAFEQDRELVAAEARHRVGRSRRLHQPLRRRLQQAIAGVVAERVVDVLEVVEVEEHDRHAQLRALRQRQRVLDPVPEQAAVGEQRERVVERELAQLLLERLALADVAEIERQPGDGRVVGEVAADALERAAPVAGLDHGLDGTDRAAARRGHLGEERATRSRSPSAQRSSRLRPTSSSG